MIFSSFVVFVTFVVKVYFYFGCAVAALGVFTVNPKEPLFL